MTHSSGHPIAVFAVSPHKSRRFTTRHSPFHHHLLAVSPGSSVARRSATSHNYGDESDTRGGSVSWSEGVAHLRRSGSVLSDHASQLAHTALLGREVVRQHRVDVAGVRGAGSLDAPTLFAPVRGREAHAAAQT